MKIWIARDKDGDIKLFQEKPFIIDKRFHSDGFWMKFKQTNNNRTFLKHITFENSPQQVELKLVEK